MTWDEAKEKAWKKAYAIKNRKKMNSYARSYYAKNKDKHIERVLDWKKRNADKIAAYNSTPKAKAQRRAICTKYREAHKEELREYNRGYMARKKLIEKRAKIVVRDAVERKFGWTYWIDKEGNLCGTKIDRADWHEKKKSR